jgi:spore photoproduct lyase
VNTDYPEKFARIRAQTLFHKLDDPTRDAVHNIAFDNRLTLQELKLLVNASIDLQMWNAGSLVNDWQRWRAGSRLQGREFKKWAFRELQRKLDACRNGGIAYTAEADSGSSRPRRKIKIEERPRTEKIFGMCPVMSEKTLCCNLRTIDAVKNCGFGCNYCSIQTLFTDEHIQFDSHFRDKLEAIELDPERYYHIGTGQSSDALMWGNKHNILEDMLWFARKWPRALIEFKTKSNNTGYLLQADVPANIVCTWSLNPDLIISNEELYTAGLAERLQAARKIADRHIRVGFHLHPMIHYQGWQEDYHGLINRVLGLFRPEETLFVSFGALTFPKPVLQRLRSRGGKTRISQTALAPNPEGKLSYPDEIKQALFSFGYESFRPWHDKVFFYLCMEEAGFWEASFGFSYPDNATLEQQLLESAWTKLPARS